MEEQNAHPELACRVSGVSQVMPRYAKYIAEESIGLYNLEKAWFRSIILSISSGSHCVNAEWRCAVVVCPQLRTDTVRRPHGS